MDTKLLLLINREWTSPFLDRLLAIFSSFDLWAPLLAVAAVLAAWRGDFRVRAMLLVIALTLGISDGVVCRNLKKSVSRLRPAQAMEGVRSVDLAKAKPRLLAVFKPLKVRISKGEGGTEGRSFPSSHTVNTVSAAAVLALFLRRRGWIAFLPALLVAYSRVYTGSHWPSDIAASIFLGLGMGLVFTVAAEWLWRRFGQQALPALHASHGSLLESDFPPASS